MDTAESKKPKSMAKLLPRFVGLLSKDAIQEIILSATKKPRSRMANTRTSGNVLNPLTITGMRTQVRALQIKSPKTNMQITAPTKKKTKLENRTVSHTANEQMKHNSVRKVLNFQQPKPKAPKIITNTRMTMMNSETTKSQKPEMKVKKSLHVQARNTARISKLATSDISDIPGTSIIINKPIKSGMTLANKENIPNQPKVYKKLIATPKSTLRNKVLSARIPDTQLLINESWKSSTSFLQNEQAIEYIESKFNAMADDITVENIAEISPPMCTPFRDDRNVKDLFDMSNIENSKSEESVIVSLSDMLNKATVSTEKHNKELDDLLEVQKQTESNLKMIKNSIKNLKNIEESQLKCLQHVNKLILEKINQNENLDKIDLKTESTKKISFKD